MVTAKDPLRVALNKVYPATVYARPAVAPLVVGVIMHFALILREVATVE